MSVKVADWPAVVVTEVGAEIEKSPVAPERATVCGLPEASSVTLNVPVRVPSAVGRNVTLIEHLAPAASEPPQVLVSAKSPLAEMLVIVKVALPLFVSVTVWAALVVPTAWPGKFRLDGES